ncbi:hypothetical protein FSARC_5645 [Fusarium sarcochroum]|uniref:Uncharacterized protein n=1 Tax=Fusarium sarcochroum TaxID=1208366 RepID=A0A8H4TZ17_9HYPO|nr:hypothetical protein FSARC_5645 [Fusarium sarcochroum]
MEVAGLVLGAIPIASEGLKTVKKGFIKLRKWRRYEMEIDSIVSKLETQQTRLQDVCDKLLNDLVPQSRIERLIKNPLSFRDEPNLERKLTLRLWRGYFIFETTVKEIKAAVDQIREKVDSQERAASFETRRAIVSSFFDDRLLKSKMGYLLSNVWFTEMLSWSTRENIASMAGSLAWFE